MPAGLSSWHLDRSVPGVSVRHLDPLHPPHYDPTGVSGTSLVSLRSQLASKQQEAAATRSGALDPEELRARRKGRDVLSQSNPGVTSRDARDRADLPATPGDVLAASRAALERKAALYERLAAGEESAGGEYEVDFALKAPDTARLAVAGGLVSRDMLAERDRRAWEEEVEANHAQESEAEARRRSRIDVSPGGPCVLCLREGAVPRRAP